MLANVRTIVTLQSFFPLSAHYTVKTTPIRCITIRESVGNMREQLTDPYKIPRTSQHYRILSNMREQLTDPYKIPRISQHYRIDGFKGGP